MCLYKSVGGWGCWRQGSVMQFRSSMSKTLALIPSTEQEMKGKHKDREEDPKKNSQERAEDWKLEWAGRAVGEPWTSEAFARVGSEGTSQSVGREESCSRVSTCKMIEIYLTDVWAQVSACVQHVCSGLWQSEEGITGVTGCCELSCRCWELNPGHLQEQKMLLTTWAISPGPFTHH